nr:hypothetical protein BCU55_02590 [Shewanella sp. 10N.286.48.A6]
MPFLFSFKPEITKGYFNNATASISSSISVQPLAQYIPGALSVGFAFLVLGGNCSVSGFLHSLHSALLPFSMRFIKFFCWLNDSCVVPFTAEKSSFCVSLITATYMKIVLA